jgi:hypothetical protein
VGATSHVEEEGEAPVGNSKIAMERTWNSKGNDSKPLVSLCFSLSLSLEVVMVLVRFGCVGCVVLSCLMLLCCVVLYCPVFVSCCLVLSSLFFYCLVSALSFLSVYLFVYRHHNMALRSILC